MTGKSHITAERMEILLTMLSAKLVENNINLELILCGGAVMVAVGARNMTDDLDTVKQMSARCQKLIHEVANDFNSLYKNESPVNPNDWLNDDSYEPAPKNLPYAKYKTYPNLVVNHLTPEAMLASKIQASRNKDYKDIEFWIKHIGVSTRTEFEDICKKYKVALTVEDALKEQNEKFDDFESEFDDGGVENQAKQERIAQEKITQRLIAINHFFQQKMMLFLKRRIIPIICLSL